jgi:phosphate transport system protein
MTSEARGGFHRALDRLDIAVGGLLALVPDAVVGATTALLVSDSDAADDLERWRRAVADMYSDIDATIEVVVARQSPVAGDLRFLLACIRVVPVLHEVVSLVADIAGPSRQGIGEHLTPRVISLTEQLGATTAGLWTAVGAGWERRDATELALVRSGVDEAGETRSSLAAELASGAVPLPVALEMAVTARTFDRLAHHAGRTARLLEPVCRQTPGAA